jgi:hypothetical protein
MMFSPELLGKLGGGFTCTNQLAPLDRPTTRSVVDPKPKQEVRFTRHPEGGNETGKRMHMIHEYATTGRSEQVSFLEEVFFG